MGRSWRTLFPRSSPVLDGRFDAATDSGMFLLWSPDAFTMLDGSYEAWEGELLEEEDLLRYVVRGAAVPVNLGSDMACGFAVRVSSSLTDRERQYLVVSSEPYLFVSCGIARLDGIEHVGAGVGPALPVPAGRWAVTVHLVDWEDEPGMTLPDGRPRPDALPDFVVELQPAVAGTAFRHELTTFPAYQGD